ncbi:helix-turn-helix transcriptional regulator [Actinomadura alba]|uniref:Helix-turn-helix transcriptional regulator n=1 Tax=Actinomadura alba TaxID=406431 RepID=A0ABR7LMK2_9ACTN|nr:helix-turn-helix transcriptional regulator [Actinomadura alba]MBC6466081.1 helix-turn-helix transcriptional regulator [Actinomadura alba]
MSDSERPGWAVRLRAEREARGWNKREMARRLLRAAGHAYGSLDSLTRQIRDWENGRHFPRDWAGAYATAFGVPEAALFLRPAMAELPDAADFDDELEALELARRAAASDVGAETLEVLEMVVDEFAIAYPGTPPAELLRRVRRTLSYVMQLLDGRKTLTEHRRLLVVGGWLSLLAATCHTDLHQRSAATARLRAAAQMAEHADHPEIAAWCLETEAWRALTDGDYQRAVTLSKGAQTVAPKSSSAYVQATAQEGRAWARLGARPETHKSLDRVARLVEPLPMPDRPEHHYRYDPAKGDAYAATTLSWLGDPSAEPYARRVLARLESAEEGPPRPRRAASARLDLSLALLSADQPDEAVHLTHAAIASGVLVPSNHWRAAEVVAAVEALRLPEAAELREAYRGLRTVGEAGGPPAIG